MSEWKEVAFLDLLEEPVRNGIYKKKEFHGRGVKIVNMGELFAFPLLKNVEMKRVEITENERKKSLLKEGDLLFARRSLTAEGAGKCSIVKEINEETTFESSIIRARPDKEKASSEFLYYYFNSPYGKYLLGTILRQVAVAGITGSDLMELLVKIPDLFIQREIAAVLSSLDDKIDLLHRQNKTLEAMAETLWRKMFVEDADPKWKTGNIGDYITVKGGTTPSTNDAEFWNGDICWTSPRDLTGSKEVFLHDTERKITKEGLAQIGSGLLPMGTVLLSSRAPIGYLAISNIPVSINQGYIAVVCDQLFSNYFMLFWIKTNMDLIIGSANGSTFLEISKSVFRSLETLIPDEKTLCKYDSSVKPMMDKLLANEIQIRKLTKMRDTLLPKLMAGEIRVMEV